MSQYCPICNRYHASVTLGCYAGCFSQSMPTEPVIRNAKQILVEQASLTMQPKLPESFLEFGDLLWKAFEFGKKYRDAGGI